MRRAGQLEQVSTYITNAEKSAERSSMAGLAFVKGIYNRYMGDPLGALKELNVARFDGFFGEHALTTMIEIYLNPQDDMIYSSSGEAEYTSTPENLKAASDLIVELSQRGVDVSLIEINKLIHSK